MSGGVDSSVSAALLKKAGYEVIGVFIRVWSPDGNCAWRAERREAYRAAAILKIPLLTIDLSVEYKKAVIDYLVAEYKAGRTPNPDVMCNKHIKFGIFYDWAMAKGADFVATGHYSQIKDGSLMNSFDSDKDQTYFLWAVEQKKLAKILFPIGKYKKSEVRKLARKFGLSNADKPDSQGLCFVGDFDFKEFLRETLGVKKGEVLDTSGQKIGEHDGAYLYTIGERHGFKVEAKSNETEPYFIINKDSEKNTLIVDHKPNVGTFVELGEIKLGAINWLIKKEPKPGRVYQARLRYRSALADCLLEKRGDDWIVKFLEPVFSPALGQSVVIYDGEQCIGGGIIFSVKNYLNKK